MKDAISHTHSLLDALESTRPAYVSSYKEAAPAVVKPAPAAGNAAAVVHTGDNSSLPDLARPDGKLIVAHRGKKSPLSARALLKPRLES